MCVCTPTIRTPYCGKPGCTWPKPEFKADDGEKNDTVQYPLEVAQYIDGELVPSGPLSNTDFIEPGKYELTKTPDGKVYITPYQV